MCVRSSQIKDYWLIHSLLFGVWRCARTVTGRCGSRHIMRVMTKRELRMYLFAPSCLKLLQVCNLSTRVLTKSLQIAGLFDAYRYTYCIYIYIVILMYVYSDPHHAVPNFFTQVPFWTTWHYWRRLGLPNFGFIVPNAGLISSECNDRLFWLII